MTDPAREARQTLLSRYASKLRFPQLFMLTATLFLIDLIVPDFVPFADEILLGLLTLLLANWKKSVAPADDPADKPAMKDVTPRD
jgi:hypothetical protein